MASRARTRRIANDANTRAKIQATHILKRLSDHVDGKLDLAPSQIKAAEILLRKSLPDLSAVTISGDPDSPVVSEVMVRLVGGS